MGGANGKRAHVQVVFEAEGFSVHDLALLGQKNSPETVIRQDLVRHLLDSLNNSGFRFHEKWVEYTCLLT